MILKKIKLKMLGQPHDKVLITTHKRLKHYKAKEDRIILKEALLFRQYNGETGNIK